MSATGNRPWLMASEVLKMPSRPFVISKLFVENSFNLLISPRKVGKTLVTTDIALTIASGQAEWAGHKIASDAQGGLVIYVLGEGVGRYKLRMRAWCEARDIDHGILTKRFALFKQALNLLDEDAVTQFITDHVPAICKRAGVGHPTLIVFDTWSRCVRAAENDEAFNTAVSSIDRIREATNGTILALHHVPKNGKTTTARGSGVLEGAIDAMFALDGDPKEQQVKFECEFAREFDAGEFETKYLIRRTQQFDDVIDEHGEPEAAPTVVLMDAKEGKKEELKDLRAAVLDVVNAHGPISVSKIVSMLGKNRKAVYNVVDGLLNPPRAMLIAEGEGPKRTVRMKR